MQLWRQKGRKEAAAAVAQQSERRRPLPAGEAEGIGGHFLRLGSTETHALIEASGRHVCVAEDCVEGDPTHTL